MIKAKSKGGKRKSKKQPVFVTLQEYVEILKQTTGLHHRMGIMLAFEAGLRISEVISLRPEHINLEENSMQIRDGKGGKDRVVILPVSWDDKVHRPLLPIPCSKRALQKEFELACERCGLYKKKPTVHFHSLRHGWATFTYNRGVKIEVVSKLLGHSDVSTTMIYTHLNPIDNIRKARGAWK